MLHTCGAEKRLRQKSYPGPEGISLTTLYFFNKISSKISCASNKKLSVMLFEQKSWRKSSVEMEVYPYKSLTTLYFFIKISSMISCRRQ